MRGVQGHFLARVNCESCQITALVTVICRHKLQPVDGELEVTDEMFAEAAAIDERQGTGMSSDKFEDLKAAIDGKPNSGDWKQLDDLGRIAVSDFRIPRHLSGSLMEGRAMDKAFLRNIFSDPRWRQIGRRLWYGEDNNDGKKYGAVAATWNPQFGNYALNCGEMNRTIQAKHRNKIDEAFVVAAMKDGVGLLEYRGAVEAEKLQAMLTDKPVRDG